MEVIYNAKTKQSTMVERVLTEEEISKIELEKVKRLTEKKITELKQQLENTDYKAIKFAEGEISEEEYEPIKQQRKAWRLEINELQNQLPNPAE